VWPGASSQRERGILLRAHPLLGGNVVTSEVFGRQVAFGSVQYERPVRRSPYGSLAIAGFLDASRAWRRPDDAAASLLHVDVGGGVRINTPAAEGKVRLDLAVGLRDGRTRLSAGYVTRWGTR
jgi:outer membrane translocation and assembly module TamA